MTNLSDLQSRNLNGIAFNRGGLSRLDAYGEPEAAELLKVVSPEKQAEISARAMTILLGESCIIDKANCLAAVEVFIGEAVPCNEGSRTTHGAVAEGIGWPDARGGGMGSRIRGVGREYGVPIPANHPWTRENGASIVLILHLTRIAR
jgi:hypothetical protein